MIEFQIVDQIIEFMVGEEITFDIIEVPVETIIFEETGPQGPRGERGEPGPAGAAQIPAILDGGNF